MKTEQKKLFPKDLLSFFIAISVFAQSASASSPVEIAKEITKVRVRDLAKEIQLPRNLFKEFEAELVTEFKNITPVFMFMPLQVQFNEVSDGHGVLQDSGRLFEFDKGGGQVDLKDLVIGSGSFFMSFPAAQFDSNFELMHFYYISQSPVKRIQNEDFGLGCGRWIDLKPHFAKFQKPNFLKVNTTELRYLYVLSGHYVLVFRQGTQIFLTQLTVTDSRYTNDLCNSLTQSRQESKDEGK